MSGRDGARKDRDGISSAMRAASFLLLAIGVSSLLYPSVCDAMARYCQSQAMLEHQQSVEALSDEHVEAMRKAAERYNESISLASNGSEKRDWQSITDEYEAALDPSGTGVMAIIEIDAIDLRLPVYHGTDEAVLRKGAGHVEQTALPIGGKGLRPVMAGHCGLPEAELFTRIDELERGDVFVIEVLGDRLAYRICEIEVVSPDAVEVIEADPDRDLATLFTCTPYGSNTHRLVVTGERIPQSGIAPTDLEDQAKQPFASLATPAAVAMLALALERKRRHAKDSRKGRIPDRRAHSPIRRHCADRDLPRNSPSVLRPPDAGTGSCRRDGGTHVHMDARRRPLPPDGRLDSRFGIGPSRL